MHTEEELDISFNEFLLQMQHISFNKYKAGTTYHTRQQPESWDYNKHNRYSLHVHLRNEHEINGNPHFHIIKVSENIDSRLNFYGEFIDDIGYNKCKSKIKKQVKNWCSILDNYNNLNNIWDKIKT